MDGGVNMQSNDEKSAEKAMDDYLKSQGLHRKKIAKDGSCLFRAVAEQVLHCQSLHTKVRAQCVDFLKKNRDIYEAFIEGDFEDYLCKLQDPQQWVGEVEINALAVMYKRDFLIYQEPGKPAVPITDNNFQDKVRLCFLNGNHYDSVYPIDHIKSAAVCQSILYELLYDRVFNVERSMLSGICQRVGRPSDVLSDDSMATCVSSDESELESTDTFRAENGTNSRQSYRGRGRGRLSERLRRSLNPTLYRNVEYDVWQKSKRDQQRLDYCIAAGMQYTVGDRCQVRLESGGRSYKATIKEVPPNNGMFTVYIEELGKKLVPLWNVRPFNEENSWSTVGPKEKKLSNGHGDWEERGKGRGRGRSTPASSSVAQATTPGTGGRTQKQHSVEEQGGAKGSRKSVSTTAESVMFGLTEEQRLAKQEEERNVALVEIQLRDEHSFPALGAQPILQGDGGKRKGGEKRRYQNKTKSPVEKGKASSPPPGERPKSSTPPLANTTTTTAAAATKNTTKPPSPTLPAASPPSAPAASTKSESSPTQLSSLKASVRNTSAATPGSTSRPALASAALTTKTNTHSYASAASGPPSVPPAAATSPAADTTPPVTGVASPHSVPSSASVFSIVTPVLPAASPIISTSTPTKTAATPPPSSAVPAPTFIAPIAPSPVAAQGFLSTSTLPRFSPSFPSLPRTPSPPSISPLTIQNSSSSPVINHTVQVQEGPLAPAQTQNCLPHAGGPLTAPQTFQSQSSPSHVHPQVHLAQDQSQISVSQTQIQPQAQKTQAEIPEGQTQCHASVPANKLLTAQMETQVPSSVPQLLQQPQAHTEVTSPPQPQMHPSVPQNQAPLLQTQASLSYLQPQSQAQYSSQTQSEFASLQSSQPPPGASYPSVPIAAVPVATHMQPHPSVTQPHLHSQLVLPPHPSQLPHPSLSLSSTPAHPTLQPLTSDTQDKTGAPPPAVQHPQPQPDPPTYHPPMQPPHSHPLLQSAHPPPHPQPIPGVVPLQQLSQLYQDPLYPGFPREENGNVAQTPSFSSSKSGDDLPKDVNILRFFFNLGLKAYTVSMFPPCIYLVPLQQAYSMHSQVPSRSPSPAPQCPPPSNPPARLQDAYPQYPANSEPVPTQYDQQGPVTADPPRSSEPSFNQAAYPITQPPPQRMPWQPQQMGPPRNSSYPVGYPSSTPPYPMTMSPSQGYPSCQDPGHPAFPPAMPPYPPSSLGYHQSPEEFQGSKVTVEQHHTAHGDTNTSHGPLEGPAAANVANANNNRTLVAHGASTFAGFKKEEESVLLVDPPLNNKPIHVNMTTMTTSTTPGSHDITAKPSVPLNNNLSRVCTPHRKPYVRPVHTEPSQVPCLQPMVVSVSCSTEDDLEEEAAAAAFNPPAFNHRGPRRGYRSRGRGGHDGGRGGQRRRQEPGIGFNHSPYGPSYGGQSWGRGYYL